MDFGGCFFKYISLWRQALNLASIVNRHDEFHRKREPQSGREGERDTWNTSSPLFISVDECIYQLSKGMDLWVWYPSQVESVGKDGVTTDTWHRIAHISFFPLDIFSTDQSISQSTNLPKVAVYSAKTVFPLETNEYKIGMLC